MINKPVIWSPQQERALSATAAWLRDPDGQQVFRLFGYAGTGKTTLVKHIAEGVDGKVLFAAFTGKAAHVMREKGCPDASTIHRLIYCPTTDEDGRALCTVRA
jgi:exodeoxyribonuclease-5